MFWNILLNENTKIFRRRLFWAEILFFSLIVVGILLALFFTVETNRNGSGLPSREREMLLETVTWPQAWVNVLRLAGWDGIGPLFLIVLVGALTAQEYRWRTHDLWLTRGVSRPMVSAAKLIALCLGMIVMVSAVLLVGGITTAIFSAILDGTLHIEEIDLPHMLSSILRTIITLLPYGSLTFLLAVRSRSSVVAIGGGLAYTLLIENLLMEATSLLGERFASLSSYLPAGLAHRLLALNNASLGNSGITGVAPMSPQLAIAGICIWTLVFAGIGLLVFQRQDLGG